MRRIFLIVAAAGAAISLPLSHAAGGVIPFDSAAVVRRDADAAVEALRRGMGYGRLGLQDARVLQSIARKRGDRALLAEALGVQVLNLGGDIAAKMAAYRQFVAAYPALRRRHPTVSSDPQRYLDSLFQQFVDRSEPVTRHVKTGTGRMVILEYDTGLNCGACWGYDRMLALLLQRYAPDELAVLAFQMDCPPLSNELDSSMEQFSAWYPSHGAEHGVRWGTVPNSDRAISFDGKMGKRGDGKLVLNGIPPLVLDDTGAWDMPGMLRKQIDTLLERAPGARLSLATTVRGGALDARLAIEGVAPAHAHVVARFILLEDTVRMTGETNRRLHYGVVRAASRSADLSLAVPLTHDAAGRAEARYTFALDTLAGQFARQRSGRIIIDARTRTHPEFREQLESMVDRWPQLTSGFPDRNDWRMQAARLHVVALVQDLDTGEVLQTVSIPVATGAAERRALQRVLDAP